MRVARHIQSVTQKALNKVTKVVRLFQNKRIDYELMRRLYQGVYGAIVVYAAGGWAEIVTETLKKKLNREERKTQNGIGLYQDSEPGSRRSHPKGLRDGQTIC